MPRHLRLSSSLPRIRFRALREKPGIPRRSFLLLFLAGRARWRGRVWKKYEFSFLRAHQALKSVERACYFIRRPRISGAGRVRVLQNRREVSTLSGEQVDGAK